MKRRVSSVEQKERARRSVERGEEGEARAKEGTERLHLREDQDLEVPE